jgi:hypothetical protein
MKGWLIALTAFAAFALVAAPSALAAGRGKPQDKAHNGQANAHHGHAQGKPHHGQAKGKVTFKCEAKVVSAEAASGILVVTVKSGSTPIKAYRGTQIKVQVDPEPSLINASVDPSVSLTLDQLVPDAQVYLSGAVDRSTPDTPAFTATRSSSRRCRKPPRRPLRRRVRRRHLSLRSGRLRCQSAWSGMNRAKAPPAHRARAWRSPTGDRPGQ